MNFQSKKTIGILLVSISSLVYIFLFQNCSQMKFGGASSLVEVGEAIPQGIVGAGKAELTLPPVDNSVKPIEFVLLIDGSYSNKVNGLNLINGLKNFVANIPDNSLSLEVYIVGTADSIVDSRPESVTTISPTQKRSVSESVVSPPRIRIEKASGQSTADFSKALNVELDKIAKLLNDTTSGGLDTFPAVPTDLVSVMSTRRNKGTQVRTVYIYATDEDVMANYTGQTTQRRQSDQISVSTGPGSTQYNAPVKCTTPAEGGGSTVIDGMVSGCPTCYPKIDSCADTAGINAAIAARGNCYSIPTTFSACQAQQLGGGIGWQTVNASQIFLDWNGNEATGANAWSLVPSIADQILKFSQMPNQPQFFLGLFTVRSGEVKNPDQEVAQNILAFAQKITPNGNFYSASINSTDYSEFLSKVSEFKIRTENNRVSLASIYKDIPQGYTLKFKKVQILDNRTQNYVEMTKYTVSGQELILQDLSYDYQQGVRLKIDYQY